MAHDQDLDAAKLAALEALARLLKALATIAELFADEMKRDGAGKDRP